MIFSYADKRFVLVHFSWKGMLQSWQMGAMFPIDKEALENRRFSNMNKDQNHVPLEISSLFTFVVMNTTNGTKFDEVSRLHVEFLMLVPILCFLIGLLRVLNWFLDTYWCIFLDHTFGQSYQLVWFGGGVSLDVFILYYNY